MACTCPPNPVDVAKLKAALRLVKALSKACIITKSSRRELVALFKGWGETKDWGLVNTIGRQVRDIAVLTSVLTPTPDRRAVRTAAEKWDRLSNTEALVEFLQHKSGKPKFPRLTVVASPEQARAEP
jgi:hypothetical protein